MTGPSNTDDGRMAVTKKRGGRGARARREARRSIERAARERHLAWQQIGVPVEDVVDNLTTELEALFDAKRRALS